MKKKSFSDVLSAMLHQAKKEGEKAPGRCCRGEVEDEEEEGASSVAVKWNTTERGRWEEEAISARERRLNPFSLRT